MKPAEGFAGRYARLMLVGLALGAVLAGIGYLPTSRIAGPRAIPAMFAGCAIAVIAGWIGGLICCQPGGTGPQQINRMLGSTALRMAAAVGLALATALAGVFAIKPLLVWVGLAYLVTLIGETLLLVHWIGRDSRKRDSGLN